MTRRKLLAFVATIPLIGKLVPKPPYSYKWIESRRFSSWAWGGPQWLDLFERSDGQRRWVKLPPCPEGRLGEIIASLWNEGYIDDPYADGTPSGWLRKPDQETV